jgi:peptide chain release factor subunit 1
MTESKELYEFREKLKELKEYSGRGTELISVYIPPKYPISEVSSKLKEEAGQATNIKSATTKKNVLTALEKLIQYLKQFNKPPVNGMAVFCGNISRSEGKQDVQLFAVEPPAPVQVQFYRCESQFVLEPLNEMVERTDSYGLVVIDGKDATVAILKGKQLKIVKRFNSLIHQKTMKGGQSAQRFDRIHEEEVDAYYKRVGEAMAAFTELKNFQGVIIGGPGPTKENFVKAAPFDYRLKVLGIIDVGYTDEFGLKELMEKSESIIEEQEAVVEKKMVEEFTKAAVQTQMAVYGIDEVRKAISARRASRVLVSEGMEFKEKLFGCTNCELEEWTVTEKKEFICPECNGKLKEEEEKDLLAEVISQAESGGATVELVSQDTPEGKQFQGMFKGIGAFLRYRG